MVVLSQLNETQSSMASQLRPVLNIFLNKGLRMRLSMTIQTLYLVLEAEVCSTVNQELHHLKVTFLRSIKHSTPT